MRNYQECIVIYKDQLSPWCIIRQFPNLQRRTIARCRRRSDAEAHLQVLQRLMPTLTFTIVFDVKPEDTDSPAKYQKPQFD
jgi:hypothetical protein